MNKNVLPEIYQNIVEFNAIFDAEEPEFDRIKAKTDRTEDNFFVWSMDEETLLKWEKWLKISASGTLEDRKSFLLLRYFSILSYTRRGLTDLLQKWCNDGGVVVEVNGFEVSLILPYTVQSKSPDILRFVRSVIPANMGLNGDIQYREPVPLPTPIRPPPPLPPEPPTPSSTIVFTPPPGEYFLYVEVALSTDNPTLEIWYTVDPEGLALTRYTTPLILKQDTVIRAMTHNPATGENSHIVRGVYDVPQMSVGVEVTRGRTLSGGITQQLYPVITHSVGVEVAHGRTLSGGIDYRLYVNV